MKMLVFPVKMHWIHATTNAISIKPIQI